ncbi:MAG: extracellular solute-binding protein [Deltaproteobacteria bacterium]|nr:extracellular solute-binding protein [Deltaproteobacteria bacterium]
MDVMRDWVMLLTLIFVWLPFGTAPAVAQETAGQLLTKLDRLPPEKRQAVLVEAAKAEREITFYSSMQAQQLDALTKAFNKRFPFLKVNTWRASGNKQFLKVQTEYSAGRPLVDVVNATAEEASALKKIGVLDPYRSPQREFFSTSDKDKEGYFTSLYVIPMVLGYNTKMLKRNEVPTSYQDLLNPKWTGQMFLDNEPYDWFAVLLRHFGKERGLQYMRNLAKQDLVLIRGRTAQSQLLVAGERPIAIVLSGHTVLDLKANEAPIDWVGLEPFFSSANYIMLGRRAPHPHAGALFVDWALSEEGQSVITSFGRVVARRGVRQRFPELLERQPITVDPNFIAPILEESSRQFREIFLDRR